MIQWGTTAVEPYGRRRVNINMSPMPVKRAEVRSDRGAINDFHPAGSYLTLKVGVPSWAYGLVVSKATLRVLSVLYFDEIFALGCVISTR